MPTSFWSRRANYHSKWKKQTLAVIHMEVLRLFGKAIINNCDRPSPGTAQALCFISNMLREISFVADMTEGEFRRHVKLTCYP
jgi:hypothetical protein